MSEAEKPQTEAVAPASETPSAPSPPAAPTPTAPAPPAAPPPPKPHGKGPPPRGRKGPPPGGRVRRVLDPVPSLENDLRFASKPHLKDLDAEIAGEMEAALGGMSEKDLFEAPAQPKQAATPEQTARKKGKVLSVHGADVFVDVPGGRSQGVLPMTQFPDGPPKVGSEVEFEIEGYDGAKDRKS